MKAVIDTSTLISLSESCLFNLFGHLKEKNKIEFLISESVYNEAVQKPLEINRFKLSAVRIKEGVSKGIIQVVKNSSEMDEIIAYIEQFSENIFMSREKTVKVMHRGEIDALALVKHAGAKTLIIDEKTTRMIIEDPFELKRIIEKRQGINILLNKKRYDEFKKYLLDFSIIRSSELIALAFEQGLLARELGEDKEALEAALYSVKFQGCALSEYEIEHFLKHSVIQK